MMFRFPKAIGTGLQSHISSKSTNIYTLLASISEERERDKVIKRTKWQRHEAYITFYMTAIYNLLKIKLI
jgi:hypothetical protein